MDIVLSFIAGVIGVFFLIELLLKSIKTKRPNLIFWTIAIGMYTIATLALAYGLFKDWNQLSFGIFYFFGGITNVPAFGLGSAYLVFKKDNVNIASGMYALFVLGALYSMLVAPDINLANIDGIPEGRELYEITGPRLWAIVGNSIGSLALIGIGIVSIIRYRDTNQDLVTTNVLIVLGSFAPAFSGVLLALGDGESKALSLLVGILLIFLGYKISQRIDYSGIDSN